MAKPELYPVVRHRACLQITLEFLCQILDLPNDMQIVQGRTELRTNLLELVVESPLLPGTKAGELLPTITPVYGYGFKPGQVSMIRLPGYEGELDGALRRALIDPGPNVE